MLKPLPGKALAHVRFESWSCHMMQDETVALLRAWIKLKSGVAATPAEIQEFCKEQIARYKVPRYIKFSEQLPLTSLSVHELHLCVNGSSGRRRRT